MHTTTRWFAASLLVAGLGVAGCVSTPEAGTSGEKPAKVEKVEGGGPARITLTAEAVKRLDVATAPVREKQVAGQTRKVIPYSAVLYDPQGAAWAFTSPASMTYIRARITVENVVGDEAILSDGPPVGTGVVTVGVAELYGAELGVGK